MCDYSLAGLPNRLAVESEELVAHRFATGTLGLTSACAGWKDILLASSKPAVCVPPGARLLLRDIPHDLQQRLGVGAVEEVTFVQQSAEVFRYRDAVHFANGREILLQHLHCGQRVDVLSLGGVEQEIKAPNEEQEYRAISLSDETVYEHSWAIARRSRPS